MPAVTLNGNAFNGTVSDADSVRRAPQKATPKPRKVGKTLEAASGARTFMYRGGKTDWELAWEKVPEVTRAAVRAVFDLTTTFPYIDPSGASWTVQCEETDYQEELDVTLPDGTTRYYNVRLTVRQP